MSDKVCMQCNKDSNQAPLLPVHYRDQVHWICPVHLPVLIHQPARLADKLPGIENLTPPEGHHHD